MVLGTILKGIPTIIKITKVDYKILRALGYSKEQAAGILSGVWVANINNYFNEDSVTPDIGTVPKGNGNASDTANQARGGFKFNSRSKYSTKYNYCTCNGHSNTRGRRKRNYR